MRIFHWLVLALSIICATMAVVLPRECLQYIMVGGTMVLLVFFMVLNIFLLFMKDKKRKSGSTSDGDAASD